MTFPFAAALDEQVLLHREAIETLLDGNWAEGFERYRHRLITRHPNAPIPDGDTVLDYADHLERGDPIVVDTREQGIGDALFFLRWCAGWQTRQHTYLLVDPKLRDLLSHNGFRCNDPTDEVPGAMVVMVGDLPYLQQRFSDVPPLRLDSWHVYRQQLEKLVLGDSAVRTRTRLLVWRAGAPEWQKEIPLQMFGEYIKGVCKPTDYLGSITRFPRFQEIQQLEQISGYEIVELFELNEDLMVLAALFNLTHQYIGVSSAAAHLFGSCGAGSIKIFPHGGLSWYWKSNPQAWYPRASVVTWEGIKNEN
jgi:hypothetical protein